MNNINKDSTVKTLPPTIVVSAPSGAGKTTLNRRLASERGSDVEISVSHTTRAKRKGEIEGVHYYFVDIQTFQQIAAKDQFLEWALVHGNYYGTSIFEIKRILSQHRAPILEIDVQGWRNARPKLDHALAIFILPPSFEVLWKRLEKRGSDNVQTRFVRLQNAYEEIQSANIYDYFIINNDLNVAYKKLKDIIFDEDIRNAAFGVGREHCAALLEEYDSAGWIKDLARNYCKAMTDDGKA